MDETSLISAYLSSRESGPAHCETMRRARLKDVMKRNYLLFVLGIPIFEITVSSLLDPAVLCPSHCYKFAKMSSKQAANPQQHIGMTAHFFLVNFTFES